MPSFSDMLHSRNWSVYILEERDWDDTPTGWLKIGSARTVANRLSGLIGGNPRKLIIVYEQDLGARHAALTVEKGCHQDLARYRQPNREWFRCPLGEAVAAAERCVAKVQPHMRPNIVSRDYRMPA